MINVKPRLINLACICRLNRWSWPKLSKPRSSACATGPRVSEEPDRKDNKTINYYHTREQMILIKSIKEKIINICQNYLDRFEGPKNVIFNMLSSNASSDFWNLYEHTANFSNKSNNGNCGPVACVYLFCLTQLNGRWPRA